LDTLLIGIEGSAVQCPLCGRELVGGATICPACAALAEAQQRADRIQAFRAELAELRREGLLSIPEPELEAVEAHHRRILMDLVGRFDVDISEHGEQLSLGMRIASIVGLVALGAQKPALQEPRYRVRLCIGRSFQPWITGLE